MANESVGQYICQCVCVVSVFVQLCSKCYGIQCIFANIVFCVKKLTSDVGGYCGVKKLTGNAYM